MDAAEDDIPDLLDTTSPDEPVDDVALPKVPLTIITGFLGAGKSTLLQYILSARHGYRIAVIMNEFADSADIESRTINVSSDKEPGALTEEVLELANGCLCCSIKDSGAAAIEKLMQKRGRFDYILLETTGLADPGPIATMFWDNESMSDSIYLDGVICVVDGLFALKTMDGGDNSVLGSKQIASSDVILLNKCDIAQESDLSLVERSIARLNPAASVFRTVRGEMNVGAILDLKAYSSAPSFKNGAHTHDHHDGEEGHDHEHELTEKDSFSGVSSLVIPLPILSPVQSAKLDEWLRTLLWEGRLITSSPKSAPESGAGPAHEILRCKGVYSTSDGRTLVIQGVRVLYETKQEATSTPGDIQQGKLVLIGTLGNREAIASSFAEHLALHV